MKKEKWIEKHLREFAHLAEKFPEKKLIPAEKFPFLGQDLTLRLVPTPLRQVFFSRHENFLQLHLPEAFLRDIQSEQLQEYFPKLQHFYQTEAEKLIRERMRVWSEQMKLFPRAVKLRNQRTRWGSCSSRGSIQINWRLIGAPLEVIDYILIHELSHLKHMNHSHEFWNLVEQHCPTYQDSEQWLRDNHSLLDFLLK